MNTREQPVIAHYSYNELGRANHGWLDARHHFSFASYHNPNRMNFGVLRVINDDIIKAGGGFDSHPHRDMEIITYVREGAITHRDNLGNEGITKAGDVQVMSAGTGVFHSEYNLESEDTRLYQIWIEPNQKGVQPRWDAHSFPKEQRQDGKLTLLVSGDGTAPLFIHQDAYIYGGTLKAGEELLHRLHHRQAYLLVSKGAVLLDGKYLTAGDGAELHHSDVLQLSVQHDAELLLIDLPNPTNAGTFS